MNRKIATPTALILFAGDAVTLALVTVLGFASHNASGTAGYRMLSTFLPLLLAWSLVAPHLKVFEAERAVLLNQLWRPVWAMLLAAPFAAWARGVGLGTPIMPVFVVVIGGFSAIGLLVWRLVYLLMASGFRRSYG